MALVTKSQNSTGKKAASGNTGAAVVSGDSANTKNNDALTGGKASDQIKATEGNTLTKPEEVIPKRDFYFTLPFAKEGKANVNIPVPLMDENGKFNGKVKETQVELIDGAFKVKKKYMKNAGYWKKFQETMKKSGFVGSSTITNLKEYQEYKKKMKDFPEDEANKQKILGAIMPEHADSDKVFNSSFQCGDKTRVFKMVKGRLYTDDPALHKIFLKNGFVDIGYVPDTQKVSEEVLPKKVVQEEE